MISGYTRVGMVNEALGLFREMQKVGVEPDEVSLVSVISACAAAGALDIGRWIHAFIKRRMINMDLELSTSLVNMYAKCGCIEKAKEIFDEMPVKDSKAWSSMINAFAIHGLGGDAVEEYTRMEEAKVKYYRRVKPNHITFLGLLSACARGGLISEGRRFWSAMLELGIEPSLEHYGCMIDLLCRVGLVDEAFRFVETITVPADPAICRTLLLGCKKNGLLQQAQIVSNHLLKLEPLNPENYIIVANFYASASQWEMMSHVRKRMKETGIKTVPGCSSIEVGGLVHEFVRGGQSHPEAQEIKEFLKDAYVAIHDTGHKPIVSSELPNVGEEVKEDALYEHSERLAIAYGLLKTKAPAVIRIMKNLRLCEDSHEVAKFLSKIYKREIIVRDRFCLHKFFNGKCSCADYW
ncbi:hypothetical protein K2173_018255 [Erythroxylum novogranatense]|uniref:DYW domain-containing protein n=1 Tax=Erythroxylum novogranatense TaxID=1862640 RepID=A0AAV8UCT0_9ROSI|nr:hypothetical protein K2173_018255 [Erythroxylum novogranatense]